MRLSSLSIIAVFLLFSFLAFAQHSSSGGSSSSGNSSSGSHAGASSASSSSAGSSVGHNSGSPSYSSGGTHTSSGGSSIHSAGASHGSNAGFAGHGPSHSSTPTPPSVRGTMSAAPAHAIGKESASDLRRSPPEPGTASEIRPAPITPPEKRGFFSFLRHPFRKPEPKHPIESDRRRPLCFRGVCTPCPVGQVRAGFSCAAAVVPIHKNSGCFRQDFWNSGTCFTQLRFLDDCSGLRIALERQLRRTREAELQMQSFCSTRGSQACSGATASWNSEQNLYRSLEVRYRACMATSTTTSFFAPYGIADAGSGLIFNPLAW